MSDSPRPRSTRRAVVERLALISGGTLAGLVILALLEGTLRLTGLGAEAPRRDPFAGFSEAIPMFEQTTHDGTPVYRVSAARTIAAIGRTEDQPQREFVMQKPPHTFRVFVLGDSSAAGVPYGTGFAFSSWLERRLSAALPDRRFEVVNAAMPGYATRRVVVLAKEVAHYAPDLVVVYNGHNEFAERRYYAHLLDTDPRLFRLREALVSTRLWALAARALADGEPAAETGPLIDVAKLREAKEMFEVLDKRAGGEGYATMRERSYGEMLYRFNLESIVRTLRAAGAPVVLITLSQDFASWRPGASAHRPDLEPAALADWKSAVDAGRTLAAARDCPGALAAYRRALAIDDTYAELHYDVAACEEQLGRYDIARAHYRRASDLDQVPHGAPTRFNDILREVAQAENAILADADAALTAAAPHGLVGNELFTDWVHPTIRAHQVIAATVAAALRQAGVPVPAERWADGYQDRDVAQLYADDPALRTRERMAKLGTCLLAHREACALAEVDALLAAEPDNGKLREVRDHVVKRAAGWHQPAE